MKIPLLLSVALLVTSPVAQDDQEAVRVTERVVTSIEACPERVVTAQFKKKWVKETWGPPAEVKYDIERTSSILYPFTATVDFSLTMRYGKYRKTREEAAADTELKPLLTGRYRNIYKITKDGNLVLDSTSVTDFKSGQWGTRPRWVDACWDRSP